MYAFDPNLQGRYYGQTPGYYTPWAPPLSAAYPWTHQNLPWTPWQGCWTNLGYPAQPIQAPWNTLGQYPPSPYPYTAPQQEPYYTHPYPQQPNQPVNPQQVQQNPTVPQGENTTCQTHAAQATNVPNLPPGNYIPYAFQYNPYVQPLYGTTHQPTIPSMGAPVVTPNWNPYYAANWGYTPCPNPGYWYNPNIR